LLNLLLLSSLRSSLFFPDRTHNTAQLQLQQRDTVGEMVWEASEGRRWISRAFAVLVRGIGLLCNGGGAGQGSLSSLSVMSPRNLAMDAGGP
jgi:hypothetical protein